MSIGGHHNPTMQTDVWLTPKNIIEELGPFDLDPCAAIDQPWKTAHTQYTIMDDGLSKQWNGFVWCNPPYGKVAATWLRRMVEHNNGIVLMFARMETKMFFDYVWNHTSALLFIKGRLFFCYPDGTQAKANSGGPSVLVGYGNLAAHKLESCNIEGKLIV